MSELIDAKIDLTKKVQFQRGEKTEEEKEEEEEERGNADIYDNTDNVMIYDNCWTKESTPPPKPPDNTTDDQQKKDEERRNADIYHYINNVVTAVDPGPLKRTLPGAPAVFLGLLCLVLLAAVIVMLVLWIQDQNNWNTQRKRLTEDNTYLTRERDELQTNYSLIETQKNLLTAKNNNLTMERDELQTNYSLIEKQKNLLTAKNNNLTTERDELQKQLGWPCYYPTHIQCWTDWFDRDDPSGPGDRETLFDLRKENPGKICPKPVDIEAQTLSGTSVAAAGEVIYKNDTIAGFICRNLDQRDKRCNDYRVRFSCHPPFCGGGVCWTRWYNRDNPSGTGDWERLIKLRSENPGQICEHPLYIEAVTTDTMTPAISTGEIFFFYNPTRGFACRKTDQKDGNCRDYKVRFGCPC